jgi:hypothetical protein
MSLRIGQKNDAFAPSLLGGASGSAKPAASKGELADAIAGGMDLDVFGSGMVDKGQQKRQEAEIKKALPAKKGGLFGGIFKKILGTVMNVLGKLSVSGLLDKVLGKLGTFGKILSWAVTIGSMLIPGAGLAGVLGKLGGTVAGMIGKVADVYTKVMSSAPMQALLKYSQVVDTAKDVVGKAQLVDNFIEGD